MVKPTIKSLQEEIKEKDKTIADYFLIVQEKNDTIKFLEERLEITKTHFYEKRDILSNTINLLEDKNSILTETVRVQQEHAEIKKQQKDRIRERLLSLSIGQRLFSWKEVIIKNLP